MGKSPSLAAGTRDFFATAYGEHEEYVTLKVWNLSGERGIP